MIKISVVVDDYKEGHHIKPLIGKINDTLEGLDYEIIYVKTGQPLIP